MRRNKLQLYLHLIWATWNREPLITPDIERGLYRCVESEAQNVGCKVLALNGVADHVHVVLSIPTTVTIAALVKQMKGVSSRLVNTELAPDRFFKWQGYYGAFTVSRWDVDSVVAYVKRQKEHHQEKNLRDEWEAMFEEVDE